MEAKRTIISKWKKKNRHGDENLAMVVYHFKEKGKTKSITRHEKI